MSADKVNLCGVWIDNISMAEAITQIENFIKEKEPVYVVTPNVDHVVKIQDDEEFKRCYMDSSLVLCDGAPLVWASKFLKNPIKYRVCGSNLFPKFSEVAAKKKYKLFFLGGKSRSAIKSAEAFRNLYPGIQIVGIYSPPFGFEKDEEENHKIIKMIKDARPDVLFVGLGTPKQEKWIHKYYKTIGVPVIIGIGASFEFISGKVRRAPIWIQRIGFEWLWRLMLEPSRLWKRYLWDDMSFFLLVLKQKFKKHPYQ